jgi:hypothetical protein
MRHPLLVCVLALFGAASATASGPTVDTLIGAGIGTSVDDVFGDGSGVPVRTSIASVSYEAPRRLVSGGLAYREVKGTVRGVGWGGLVDPLDGPFPSDEAEAPYTYDVPFVLRWPAAFDGTLVAYLHGRPHMSLGALGEAVLGEASEARRYDEAESGFVSPVVLAPHRGHALFAANLGGFRRDGTFSATATGGPFAGRPVSPCLDVPIARDLALVARRLVERLAARPVARTIGVGHSGGALVLQSIVGGASMPFQGPHAFRRVFTGGNFVSAYDPASGLVFDGIVALAGGAPLLHPQFPATAPAILVVGEADYAPLDAVVHASRLLRAGRDADAVLRISALRNLPHNFAEIVESTPNLNRMLHDLFGVEAHADGDRMAPVVAAMIDRLREWIADGTPPPPSRINARTVDGDGDGLPDAVAFAQAGGAVTSAAPLVTDPAIDVFAGFQVQVTAAAGEGGLVRRFDEVLRGTSAVTEPVELPSTLCRRGGFVLGADARLVPFPDLDERWRNPGLYEACLAGAGDDLDAEGLYDRRLAR